MYKQFLKFYNDKNGMEGKRKGQERRREKGGRSDVGWGCTDTREGGPN